MENEENENKADKPENDIEKRRPKPFRYVSTLDDLSDSKRDEIINHTIMTDEKTTSEKLRKNFESTLGIGDMDTVENVLKKHKVKRDNEKNIDIL